jgi:hypothetical protein
MRHWLAVVGLLAAAPASAQSINVSFGDPGRAPTAGYAAAGSPGVWNTVSGIADMSFPLVAIDGAATGVTLSQTPTTTMLSGAADPALGGDDARLLETGLVTGGAETCLTFSGLRPGVYELFIYAWMPNAPTVLSRTRQDSAPSTIDVGGAWTGRHVAGITYARYVVSVGSDGTLPAHSGLAPGQTQAALNGVQLRPLASPADAGGAGPAPSPGGGCAVGPGKSQSLSAILLVLAVAVGRWRWRPRRLAALPPARDAAAGAVLTRK